MEEKIWHTKDGREIPITQMHYFHLCNAYRLLKSKGGVNTPEYELIVKELQRRSCKKYYKNKQRKKEKMQRKEGPINNRFEILDL